NAQLLEEVRARLDQVVQLKENTERVLESSPAGIAVLDGGDRVVSANPAFRALLGRAEADFLGRPFLELVPLDHVPRPGDGLTEARVELGGSERHLQLSAAAMAAAGEAEEQRLVVLQDVSDRVAMEDALRERE